MLDFIDTSLFNKDETIRVAVYSDNFDRSKLKVERLIDGENVLEKKVYHRGIRTLVEKDGIKIIVMTVPLSESAKGFRTVYSIVDKNIFNMKFGAELFFEVVSMSNVMYSHLLADNQKQPNARFILF